MLTNLTKKIKKFVLKCQKNIIATLTLLL